MIREYNDAEISEIALIENIQREDLNAIEEARAYARLMKDFGLTQDIMARKLARSRSHIANFLRLLKLEDQVQEYVANGTLSMGQAKPLLALENQVLQREAAECRRSGIVCPAMRVVGKEIVDNPQFFKEKDNETAKKESSGANDVFLEAAVELTHVFGTQVKIYPGKKKSKIEIEFYSPDDLERIMGTILARQEEVNQQRLAALRKVSLTEKFTV